MKSIILILPYFGKWPVWFEAHLISIAKNPSVNWLMVTDCSIPEKYPTNITFVKTSLAELNIHVNQIVEANVPLTPRKFCDLKPAYGDIFKQYITEYDFWGFCDMDIIWGDIRKFITDDILNNYDIISSRKEAISGHFNLFKNTAKLNTFYKQIPGYRNFFEEPKFMWFDEVKLTEFIKQSGNENKIGCRVYWPSILLNQERGHDSRQEYYLNRWLWDEGKLINTKTKNEVMYLHFINWKRFMKYCDVNYTDQSKQFYISYSGIHYELHSGFQKTVNTFKNYFDGYYKKLWRFNKRKQIKKIIKRLRNL